MSRFCFCNCPAGFSADPERHAPDCPGRSGAGKARTPVPAVLTDSQQVDSGVDFGIDGRSVRVSQEAYSIFLAREAAGREKIAALQMRLNAADQKNDELTVTQQGDINIEPPHYKPGLYAVRHIDNWDGERDVALTFARLDAAGKWTHEETGEALLVYCGDKVLRAWPLDCSDAPDAQVIGVPRDWLQEWALELVEAAQDGGQMSNQVEHLLEIHSKP